MKLRIAMALLSSCTMASAQVITNGSFESDSTPENGNHNYFGDGTNPEISATSTPAGYLPGWKFTRSDSWQYDWDGAGSAPAETKQVGIFNANSDAALWPPNPYSGVKNSSVEGGPVTGFSPFDAKDGNLYLGFYNDHAPADRITTTTGEVAAQNLTAGQIYRVDYWYAGMGETNNGLYDVDLRVEIDGAQRAFHEVLAYTNEPLATGGSTGIWQTNVGASNETVYTNWKQGSATFQATSASSALKFIGLLQGGPALLQLDNVSITQVPEPSVILAAALGAGGFLLRRRR